MNEGWLHLGADYVMVRIGLDEHLGLAVDRYGDRAVVRVIPDDEEPFTVNWPIADLCPATSTEIYEHGEARLRRRPVGPDYGDDAHRSMWDLMSDRDHDYWRSLRPTKEG